MREYLTVFLVAATVTYLLGVLAREVALRTGAVAKVRDRDVHAVPIPYFGGGAWLGGLLAAYVVAGQLPFLSLSSNDAVFRDALAGRYDALVAMYHDQGHGPVKVMGLEAGVNVTIGLPVVRTSVDHGTAFDIAGKGIANHGNMNEAIAYARRLVSGGRPE